MKIWIAGLVGLLIVLVCCVLATEGGEEPVRAPHSSPKSPVRAAAPVADFSGLAVIRWR